MAHNLAALPLSGVRVVSLALNLPGPAALMRCREMGADCAKIEPPAGDPMRHYCRAFYDTLTDGVQVLSTDLKTDDGRAVLSRQLESADVLLSSFRPSAMRKLGLGPDRLGAAWPRLSHVAIVGAAGARAEEPGHDLTYMADNDLVPGTMLPPSLYADMSGALMAAEAVLRCVRIAAETGRGHFAEVALADAAAWLALPRRFGLTQPGGMVGGAHAGYRIYPCKDGRVAVAALEPHFARALCVAAGIETGNEAPDMQSDETHRAIASFLLERTREQLDRLAVERDIPLHTLDSAR